MISFYFFFLFYKLTGEGQADFATRESLRIAETGPKTRKRALKPLLVQESTGDHCTGHFFGCAPGLGGGSCSSVDPSRSSFVSFLCCGDRNLSAVDGQLGPWPSSGGDANRTSLSARFLTGTGGLGCARGVLLYFGTGWSESAHRSCACSSTWGLLDAHSPCHSPSTTG